MASHWLLFKPRSETGLLLREHLSLDIVPWLIHFVVLAHTFPRPDRMQLAPLAAGPLPTPLCRRMHRSTKCKLVSLRGISPDSRDSLTAVIPPTSGNSNLEQRWQITTSESYYNGQLILCESDK